MARDSGLWLLLPRSLRHLPTDLVIVLLLDVLTGIFVFAPVIKETPIRAALGLPFVLFLPGYAFVAALFPEQGPSPAEDETEAETGRVDRLREGSIDGIERLALSFGLSIAISPLIGLVLNFTPFGIRLVPVVLAIGGFTLLATGIATARRNALLPEKRFSVPFQQWYTAIRAELFEPETQVDRILNLILVVSLVLAMSSVAYAVFVPKPGEAFTEFYLLTENESGDLTAANYPSNFTVGESKPLVVGITNQEHQQVNYSVVVQLQRVRTSNNSTEVLERETIERFQPTLSENETWTRRHNVTPTMTGDRLRLAYLLYRGTAPSQPTVENAYRETHLWVNVTSGAVSARYRPP